MKQKIVIQVSMNDHKYRSKVLKIAVSVSGVESAALTGEGKDRVEVVGEGVDAVELTRLLRKNVAHAELVIVGQAKKEHPKPPQLFPPPYNGFPQYGQIYEVIAPSHDPYCIIM